jgi:hypothetical protein
MNHPYRDDYYCLDQKNQEKEPIGTFSSTGRTSTAKTSRTGRLKNLPAMPQDAPLRLFVMWLDLLRLGSVTTPAGVPVLFGSRALERMKLGTLYVIVCAL